MSTDPEQPTPADTRPSAERIVITPALLRRAVAAGFVPGSMDLAVWLVVRAERLAEVERAATPKQEVVKAPRTFYTCEGCRYDTPMACTHPDPRGDVGRWQDATPTARCPGFTEPKP